MQRLMSGCVVWEVRPLSAAGGTHPSCILKGLDVRVGVRRSPVLLHLLPLPVSLSQYC